MAKFVLGAGRWRMIPAEWCEHAHDDGRVVDPFPSYPQGRDAGATLIKRPQFRAVTRDVWPPETLASVAGRERSQAIFVQGRVYCERCYLCIGSCEIQNSRQSWNESDLDPVWLPVEGHVEFVHRAPCGLECVQGGDGRTGDLHWAESVCRRCEPKFCPMCEGLGSFHRDDEVGRRDTCTRCSGVGKLPGRELWDDG